MAATADDASALDQMKLGPHHFTCLSVEPWRHGADCQIDPAIGAASQLLQLRNGSGLLSAKQKAFFTSQLPKAVQKREKQNADVLDDVK